ncbi:MAG TPA: lipoyl(octanoyl) transferase LipB [Casimicrobiaceae bacterium]|nr:lipoyl(octanoyl) transferase LipB [Casimicrobiaceae bacterium]
MTAVAQARVDAIGCDGATVRWLGRRAYEPCWRAMQAFTDARNRNTQDEIWLTEHEPVYTLGLAGRLSHVHATGVIPVIRVDRGGQVTYHGPGQLVAYLLFDLRRNRSGVRAMVRTVEQAVIDFLAPLGVRAYGKIDAPGVYVERDGTEAKLAALGLKVRNGCTYHGLALNVAMDLAPFRAIDPCGYAGLAVTSLERLGVVLDVRSAGMRLAPMLAHRLSVKR